MGSIKKWCAEWRTLTLYEKFEQIVALILTTVIAVIIVCALYDLVVQTFFILFKLGLNPLDHKVFQTLFGMFMTVLIALEFKHSILKVSLRQGEGVVQVKTVILIALLALARKFIILDFKTEPPLKLFALAFSVLVLGGIYWLLREQYLKYGK
ncbi:phosphate-starvation-inducible PsiE family protein [Thermodesulfatator atlanticus]|uniref:phosphate-starvation-inducible PsiE family protein n=1 Tax=Thermodesulfatator atlanticus TaxID=501497 RepID=UPI0005275D09|nr:phosphate-starvation-inducible PsiE family protein [Thermodesulfatator atlanticus]